MGKAMKVYASDNPAMKLCKFCRNYRSEANRCAAFVDPITGFAVDVSVPRSDDTLCGLDGAKFSDYRDSDQ